MPKTDDPLLFIPRLRISSPFPWKPTDILLLAVNTLTTVRHDEAMMNFKNSTNGAIETWVYRVGEKDKVRLLLDVSAPCKIDVQLSGTTKVNFWRINEVSFSFLHSCVKILF